jgi:hypothetical protein
MSAVLRVSSTENPVVRGHGLAQLGDGSHHHSQLCLKANKKSFNMLFRAAVFSPGTCLMEKSHVVVTQGHV